MKPFVSFILLRKQDLTITIKHQIKLLCFSAQSIIQRTKSVVTSPVKSVFTCKTTKCSKQSAVFVLGEDLCPPDHLCLSVNVAHYLNKMVTSKRLIGVIGRVTSPPRCDLRYSVWTNPSFRPITVGFLNN